MNNATMFAPLLLSVGLAVLVLAALSVRRKQRAVSGRQADAHKGVACPHLGLEDDPLSHDNQPSGRHRCHLNMQPERVDLAHQWTFCLSSASARCPWLAVARRSAGPFVSKATPRPTALLAGAMEQGLASLRAVRVAMAPVAAWALVEVKRLTHNGWNTLHTSAPHVAAVLRRLGSTSRAIALTLADAVADALIRAWPHIRSALLTTAAYLAPAATHAWHLLHLGARRLGHALRDAGRRALSASLATFATASVKLRLHQRASRQVNHELAELVSGQAAGDERGPAPANLQTLIAAEQQAEAPPAPAPATVAPSFRAALQRGIAALEAGQQDLAYQFFVQACHDDNRDARAWFWRAKTAPTLHETINCLERAATIEPSNQQVLENLDWARARRERERTLENLAESTASAEASRSRRSPMRVPPARRRYGRALATLAGAVAALLAASVCLLFGLAWLVGALPQQAVASLDQSVVAWLQLVPQPNLDALRVGHRVQVLNGYDPFLALPYVFGFLALLVGGGLLAREGWARWWAPLVVIASAALWLNYSSTPVSTQLLVALCAVAAVAAPLTPAAE